MTDKMTASEIVALARESKRWTALEYIEAIFDNFIELHGDRYFADDAAVVGGIASLKGKSVTVVGIQKGRDLVENLNRNFGSPHPEGYRKALRLMKQAEKFKRPIVTFINTAGAFCGIEAEERGEGEAIARNLYEMSGLKVPIISIIIGEGGSGGALALAAGDRVWMLENTIYAILSPEGFASILWKDSSKSAEAAELMRITAEDLKAYDVIEKIIPETLNGRPLEKIQIARILKKALLSEIDTLEKLSFQELLEQRYLRFRKF